jgi:hypothetical protein
MLRGLFWPELVQMLHNPVVLPADVAVGFWPKPVAPGIMPVTAAQLLAGGTTARPCVWPQGWPHAVPAQRRQSIPGALVDAGGWIPATRLPVPGSAVGAE